MKNRARSAAERETPFSRPASPKLAQGERRVTEFWR